jgi:BA14K-like protein
MKMWTRSRHLAASCLFAASLAMLANTASAAPVVDHLSIGQASPGMVETVRWRGGWGWGAPVAGGLIAGAIIGGALAAPYYGGGYYYPGPYYGGPYGGPGPAYYGAPPPGYAAPPPGYAARPPGDDADSEYCAQRYKSYDPRSGTFMGNDGRRHPCP